VLLQSFFVQFSTQRACSFIDVTLDPFDRLQLSWSTSSRGSRVSAPRPGPCPASALCAEVVQRLMLCGECPDQQVVWQVCPATVGLRSGIDGIRKGAHRLVTTSGAA